jgi:hypothetical protein
MLCHNPYPHVCVGANDRTERSIRVSESRVRGFGLDGEQKATKGTKRIEIVVDAYALPEGARFILDLGIREKDRKRMCALLAKQQKGRITSAERDELESYVQSDNVLSILKARAILTLKNAQPSTCSNQTTPTGWSFAAR